MVSSFLRFRASFSDSFPVLFLPSLRPPSSSYRHLTPGDPLTIHRVSFPSFFVPPIVANHSPPPTDGRRLRVNIANQVRSSFLVFVKIGADLLSW